MSVRHFLSGFLDALVIRTNAPLEEMRLMARQESAEPRLPAGAARVDESAGDPRVAPRQRTLNGNAPAPDREQPSRAPTP